jgi:hypothetical protein
MSVGAELKLKQNQDAMPYSPPSKLPNLDTRFMKNRRKDLHDAAIIVPDSGYASAEEGEDEGEDVTQDLDFDRIRADACERNFAIKWIVGLIARSDVWMSTEEGGLEKEIGLLDEAVELLDAFHRVGVESGKEGEKGEGGRRQHVCEGVRLPSSPDTSFPKANGRDKKRSSCPT